MCLTLTNTHLPVVVVSSPPVTLISLSCWTKRLSAKLSFDSVIWTFHFILQVSHFPEDVHISKLVDPFLVINFIQSKSCVSLQLCVCVSVNRLRWPVEPLKGFYLTGQPSN